MSTISPRISAIRIAIIVLGSLGTIAALARSQDIAHHSGAIDFYQFWLMGQYIDRPGFENIYTATVYERIGDAGIQRAVKSGSARMLAAARINAGLYVHKIEPISTPFLYVLFAMLSSGDYQTDADYFQLLGSLTFAIGVMVLARLLHFSWPMVAICAPVVLIWFGPFKVDILDGNTARMQFAGLVAAIAAIGFFPNQRGRIAAGVLFSLNVAFKPNTILAPVAVLVIFLFAREWRALLDLSAGLLLGGMIAFLGTGVYLRSFELWPAWLHAISAASGSNTSVYSLANENLSSARMISGVMHFNAFWILILGAAAVFVAPLALSRRMTTANVALRLVYASGASVLIMLLSSPIVWPSYFVFLLPMMLYLARPTAVSPWPITRWIVSAIAFLCVATSIDPSAQPDFAKLIYLFSGVTAALLGIGAIDQHVSSTANPDPSRAKRAVESVTAT